MVNFGRVRIVKVIFLLVLICKGSFLSGMDLGTDCCTQESTEVECNLTEESPSQEKKGCCDTSVCDCLCCGHIFTFGKTQNLDFQPSEVYFASNPLYRFIYTFSFDDGIWQPPRQL